MINTQRSDHETNLSLQAEKSTNTQTCPIIIEEGEFKKQSKIVLNKLPPIDFDIKTQKKKVKKKNETKDVVSNPANSIKKRREGKLSSKG